VCICAYSVALCANVYLLWCCVYISKYCGAVCIQRSGMGWWGKLHGGALQSGCQGHSLQCLTATTLHYGQVIKRDLMLLQCVVCCMLSFLLLPGAAAADQPAAAVSCTAHPAGASRLFLRVPRHQPIAQESGVPLLILPECCAAHQHGQRPQQDGPAAGQRTDVARAWRCCG
jgi:hypothetical protein